MEPTEEDRKPCPKCGHWRLEHHAAYGGCGCRYCKCLVISFDPIEEDDTGRKVD